MSERYRNLIGGLWVEPAGGEYLPDVNPAEAAGIVGEFPQSTAEDAVRAVEAAASALPAWSAMAAPARGEILRKAADILESRADCVAGDLMREEGKSLPEAKGETLRGVAILRYYAAETIRPEGEVIPASGPATFLHTRRIPLGVCALITPWNFPIAIPLWKTAPALAFGNTVVLKPSCLAPLTSWNVANCMQEAGLPAGVLNVVFGAGSAVGEALVTHTRTAGVSFTGSARTGKTIAGWAAAHGKKYQLEMGGKNAVVVLPDADLDQAVNLTLQGAFRSAGEKCTATSRAIVHREVYEAFVDRLKEKTRALKVGPGDDPSAYVGPVITADARERILVAIRRAIEEGAHLLCGGQAPDEEPFSRGFYVLPTLLTGIRQEMPIWREEVFGPVLGIVAADDEDHALALLNDTDYGLSASLFTRDLNAALAFAERAQVGMVRINGETAGVEYQAPFGGMKGSSSGSREQGQAARDFYTQLKTISIDRAG